MARRPSGPSLWLALLRTTEAMERVARASMQEAGLGFSDFVLLETLLHLGELTPGAIGGKVGLTSGSITAALDRLETRGLIARKVNPDDQRSRVVCLTQAGRAVIAPAYQAHAADIERLMSSALSTEQRGELFVLLQAVRSAARQQDMQVTGSVR
jgi:MarR family 2-MHQ and catechol resistance regulon transcriptional repressor